MTIEQKFDGRHRPYFNTETEDTESLCQSCTRFQPGHVNHCQLAKRLFREREDRGLVTAVLGCALYRAQDPSMISTQEEVEVSDPEGGTDPPSDPVNDEGDAATEGEQETGDGEATENGEHDAAEDALLLQKAKLALKFDKALPLTAIADKCGISWQRLAQFMTRWVEAGQIVKDESFSPPSYSLPDGAVNGAGDE